MPIIWSEIEFNFRLVNTIKQKHSFQGKFDLLVCPDDTLYRTIIRIQTKCIEENQDYEDIATNEEYIGRIFSCLDYCFVYKLNEGLIEYIHRVQYQDNYWHKNRFSLNDYRMKRVLPPFATIASSTDWLLNTPIFSYEKFSNILGLMTKCLENNDIFKLMELYSIGFYRFGRERIVEWRKLLEYINKKLMLSEFAKGLCNVDWKYLSAFPQIYRHIQNKDSDNIKSEYPDEFNDEIKAENKYRMNLKALIEEVMIKLST